MYYYAAYYLRQWLTIDQRFVDEFQENISVESLRGILTKYRAIRTIRNKDGKGNARLNALKVQLESGGPENDATSYIEAIERNLNGGEDIDEKRRILSAISKAAWMRWRGTLVIYDSRAVEALKRCRRASRDANYKFSARDYASFYRAWMYHFNRVEIQQQLDLACAWLPTSDFALRLAARGGPSKAQVCEWAAQQWFRIRVVDMALFDAGAKREPHLPSTIQRAELLGTNEQP